MSARPQPCGKCLCIDALNRILTCFIDRDYKDHVRFVEAALEIIHQVAKAGVAVWLSNGDHPAFRHSFARRLEDSSDFNRVVSVVVDHGDRAAIHFNRADLGEAPADPAKAAKTDVSCSNVSISASAPDFPSM